MAQISVGEMLADMRLTVEGGVTKSFDLLFVKQDGTIRHISRGSLNKKLRRKSTKNSGFRYYLKDVDAVLVYEDGAERPITVKVWHIINYQGKRVFF
jgi:hypothetical protein